MSRFGCQPKTVADRPFKYEWGEFDRCPLAVVRDLDPESRAAVEWSIGMAVAKRQGSLAAYVSPNTLSAQGDTIIEIAEDILHTREIENLEKIKKKMGAK